MQLLWLFTTQYFIVLVLSMCALIYSAHFCNQTADILLPQAPKATLDLQKVFLPPVRSMQRFVFLFDLLIMFYYVYLWPAWDGIKKKFPFFQYESKVVEKPDCSNLFLTVLFVLLTKVSQSSGNCKVLFWILILIILLVPQGLALAILIASLTLAGSNIDKIASDYSTEKGNEAAIKSLRAS